MPLASLLSSILPIYCVSQKCSMRKPTIGRLGLGHTWFLEELLKRKWARWEHNLSLLLSVQLDQPKPTILKPNIHSKLGNFCTPTWHLEGKNPTSWNFVYLPSYHTLKLLSYCEHKVYDRLRMWNINAFPMLTSVLFPNYLLIPPPSAMLILSMLDWVE